MPGRWSHEFPRRFPRRWVRACLCARATRAAWSDDPPDRCLLPPVPIPGRGRHGRHPADQRSRHHQPDPAQAPHRRCHSEPQFRTAEPVRRPDDRRADHLRAHRSRSVLPQQRHRPERHAGPAGGPLLASPAHAAALLHRDEDGRDPEPPRERRRRRPERRHRHRLVGHGQPRRGDQHGHRDADHRLASDGAVTGHAAVLHVPDLSRGQGPPRGQRRDAEIAGRVVAPSPRRPCRSPGCCCPRRSDSRSRRLPVHRG